jgi:hypothetical protein
MAIRRVPHKEVLYLHAKYDSQNFRGKPVQGTTSEHCRPYFLLPLPDSRTEAVIYAN